MSRVTHIMATSGPSSGSVEILEAMIDAGADAFRVNLSAASTAAQMQRIRDIRDAERAAGRPVTVLVDLRGRKVRLRGVPTVGLALPFDAEVLLVADGVSDSGRLVVDQPALLDAMHPGAVVLLQDGAVSLEVVTLNPVRCFVTEGGTVRPRAGVALPGVDLALPALSTEDIASLDGLDLSRIDQVALSYVGTAADVSGLRAELDARGARCRIVAKIERAQALRHIDAICAAADEVLIARGDLGVEVGRAAVPAAQKLITARARAAGCPIILATHLLETMVRAAHPTRAEINDVANAVWEGVSTLCVTAETAIGAQPIEVVRTLDAVAREAEAHPEWRCNGAGRGV